MRPLFTLHSGEYLVAERLQCLCRDIQIWVPCKDTGIDLLLSNRANSRCASLQVKFSKDFAEQGVRNCGWWTIDAAKLQRSKADYWVFVMYAPHHQTRDFVVVEPAKLLRRLRALHGGGRKIHVYLWVVNGKRRLKCWETRGLKKDHKNQIREHEFADRGRDFTPFLDNWDAILHALRT